MFGEAFEAARQRPIKAKWGFYLELCRREEGGRGSNPLLSGKALEVCAEVGSAPGLGRRVM